LEGPRGRTIERANAFILACGGASWPRLGSDGRWVESLRSAGLSIAPLQPANCGFKVDWSSNFIARFSGTPVKSIALSFEGAHARGEAVITASGLEGGAVYALAAGLREAINAQGEARLEFDLKPDVALGALTLRLERPRASQSLSTFLRKAAGMSPVAIALLRESGPLPADAAGLAHRIKHLNIRLCDVAPIGRAISSAGGVAWGELDENFMLRKLPGIFAAGEMLDWEAPTGGYLLQACFATGAAAGRGALKWLNETNGATP
jgi:uncharacterized flavoprotein (TIGR03862 family)